MEERIRKAIRIYLENKGFTLYQPLEDADYFIGYDDKDLVFIKYAWTENQIAFPDEEPIDRAEAERVALAYICEHPDIETCTLRYDYVTLIRISDSKAVVRYHKNVLA